jgi:hypothetical protein
MVLAELPGFALRRLPVLEAAGPEHARPVQPGGPACGGLVLSGWEPYCDFDREEGAFSCGVFVGAALALAAVLPWVWAA